jgi:hypothetical protein
MLPQISLERSVHIRKPLEHGGETPEYRRNSREITIKIRSIHVKIFISRGPNLVQASLRVKVLHIRTGTGSYTS